LTCLQVRDLEICSIVAKFGGTLVISYVEPKAKYVNEN